ncbi:TPA: hypothetical protein NIC68_006393 [Pseudomonas aeruginosa]|nr:hypothetical protein [Pseudomonas aeruginosa]
MPHEHITQIPDYLFTFILGVVLAFLWAFAVFLAWAWGRLGLGLMIRNRRDTIS